MTYNLFNQSNLEFLKSQPDNSIDSIVTDPPYGISFMGKSWDYDVPGVDTWKELMRVLKPGGHIIVACGTRTQHRMAVNIEDAGFEIRDIVAWVYGSGFPKSLNIGKAVDKLQGNEREVIGKSNNGVGGTSNTMIGGAFEKGGKEFLLDKGNSPYEGWGTALKPAMELWTLARKPLFEKTVAENVLKWGTGGINIDECRVGDETRTYDLTMTSGNFETTNGGKNVKSGTATVTGRFPANFIHDGSDEVVGMFPETKSSGGSFNKDDYEENGIATNFKRGNYVGRNDSGSASRFFYTAKASKSERNAGLDGFENKAISQDKGNGLGRVCNICNAPQLSPCECENNSWVLPATQKNHHPTVKPVALMRYLTRLITPKGGVVLDPYMGSGSTGVACMQEDFNFIGVEMDKEYFEIAKGRIEHWTKQ
jgi:site-specific DNA-methyltransferase (adenine-specific)